MAQLNPTVWRTCRVLSHPGRLRLLQEVLRQPERSVSQLAEDLSIGVSDASQQLRRLQSRGLLKRPCRGLEVIYRPIPDPQVPSAKPLLLALQKTLAQRRTNLANLALVAKGLACERRIAIVRLLRNDSFTQAQIDLSVGARRNTVKDHLEILLAGGWVTKSGQIYSLGKMKNPLQRTLFSLL